MKRSKQVLIPRLIKSPSFALKSLAVAVSSVLAVGCSTKEEVYIFKSIEECDASGKFTEQKCETAYRKALQEAQKTAPRYKNLKDCEYEFGAQNCQEQKSTAQSFFMPAMAGFMVSQALQGSNYGSSHYYNPLFYHYDRGYSRYKSPKWTTSDGVTIGNSASSKASVRKGDMKPKPAVTRTMSRGGFGSTVAAKTSWGGGSKKSSWGG
ncbi:hypothetical protein TDB9533_02470 [Thalassocella blandensis]|nr:hypothetical protein TDB9533_02470 [Thalassocella blandensis]